MQDTKEIVRVANGLFQKPDENNFWICSEYIIERLGSMVGIDQEEKINLRKIASIFGMGLGDGQSICGIILGCLIILSKRYGRDNVHEDRFQIYNRVVSCKEKNN
ncbi:hypothetical protein DRN58_07260 [Thermococci archaeon]|nr:MAG: hypothetical protein DRN58_07260 [Thermococci archaeon]